MLSTLKPKKRNIEDFNRWSLIYMGGGTAASSSSSSPTTTVRETAADGNLLVTDQFLLIDATTDKAITLDTPTAKGVYYIKIIAGNGNVTLTPASGLIDDQATYVFSGDQSSITLLFDGTDWWVLI